MLQELSLADGDSPEATVGNADRQFRALGCVLRAADHLMSSSVIANELDNGIAPVQCFLRRQRPDLCPQVVHLVQCAHNGCADRRM